MKISLTKDLERYIEGEVESGRYRSSEEMIPGGAPVDDGIRSGIVRVAGGD